MEFTFFTLIANDSEATMTQTFNTLIERQNTWAEKYELRQDLFGRADVIPMWVADMDLPAPDFVMAQLQQRLQHPILGYSTPPQSLKQQVCDWQTRQFQWSPQADAVLWLNGVVNGLYLAIAALTQPRDKIISFTPVYPPFMQSINHQNRQCLPCPLRLDLTSQRYHIDWSLLEAQLKQAKMLLLSNPHNPSGRVWTDEELSKLVQLCRQNHVIIVSDEIWADLNLDPAQHPQHSLGRYIQSDQDQIILLNSISKAFNLAGLQTAYALVPNPHLRKALNTQMRQSHSAEPNVLGLIALQSLYTDQGANWLTELIAYLNKLIQYSSQRLAALDGLHVIPPQAGYLLWLDFREKFIQHADIEHWCIHQAGLGLSTGKNFGEEGRGFMRMNIGLSFAQLDAALTQFERAWSCD